MPSITGRSASAAAGASSMPRDLFDATEIFEAVTRRRRAAVTYDAESGHPVGGAATDTAIRAAVQPAGPRDLDQLPDGLRERGAIKVFTVSDLRGVDIAAGTPPDEIVYAGETWRVHKVWPFGATLGTHALAHYKAIAVRADRELGVPDAPTDLTAVAPTNAQVNLAWADNAADETGYEVWREQGRTGWVRLATLAAGSVAYADAAVAPSTTYSYRIHAINGQGRSPGSEVVTVAVPA